MGGILIFGTIVVGLILWVAYEIWRAPLLEERQDGSFKVLKPEKKLSDLFKKKK
jgi:hypothetical protein